MPLIARTRRPWKPRVAPLSLSTPRRPGAPPLRAPVTNGSSSLSRIDPEYHIEEGHLWELRSRRGRPSPASRGHSYYGAVTPDALPSPRVLAVAGNLANDRLTATIVAALRADGVRAIVLKGASIREWLYEEREERLSGDVDLLVPHAARDEIDARLRTLALRYVGPSKVGRGRAYARLWQQPHTGALVELHESISGIAADDTSA